MISEHSGNRIVDLDFQTSKYHCEAPNKNTVLKFSIFTQNICRLSWLFTVCFQLFWFMLWRGDRCFGTSGTLCSTIIHTFSKNFGLCPSIQEQSTYLSIVYVRRVKVWISDIIDKRFFANYYE